VGSHVLRSKIVLRVATPEGFVLRIIGVSFLCFFFLLALDILAFLYLVLTLLFLDLTLFLDDSSMLGNVSILFFKL